MKTPPSFLLIAFLSLAAYAPAGTLFDRADAGWRWRPGTNEASTPVSAWRANGFNDSEFVTAAAPFWYGDVLPGGTQITGMSNVYLCIFLRKTFVITNIAEIAALRLGSLVDDGFTAWINGTEVHRVNMVEGAGSPVTITNLAVNATEPVSFNFATLANPSSYLVVGPNVLAVQVLQSALASSDFGFDASLESILIETTPPTVLSASPSPGSTVGGLSEITVTFSEPVTGVGALDFRINGIAASGVTPLNSSVYTFTFPQPAYGTVLITWDASHGITDQAVTPNAFNATGPGATWQYTLRDQTPPAVATLSPAPGQTVRSLTSIAVTFSEDVTGVDAADLRINGTPAASLSGGGNGYTFSFPQPTTGVVQVAWAGAHGITDLAPAPNAFVAGGNWIVKLDPNAAEGGGPIISEFMAFNDGTLFDEDNDSSDWIEIQNVGNSAANLLDWSLTDEPGNLNKWRFPATNMSPGGFLIVFASEKDRRIPGKQLHTNFKLEGSGEYLALVRPDGSIASEFAPFPAQVTGVSYGFGVLSTNSTLVSTSSPVRVRVPLNGNDGTNWLYPGFNDGSWTAGTNGVGYGTTNVTSADYGAVMLATTPLTYWRLNETSGTTAANLGSMDVPGNATYQNSPTLGAAGPRPPQLNGFEADNRAVQLSGTAGSDYVAGPAGLLNNRPAFTMAGWIRPTGPQAARTGLFGQNDCVEFGFISAGTIQVWTPSGNIAGFAYPFPDNEWHHIAVVGANSQLLLYMDGTLRTSSAGAAASGNSFNIGGGGIFDATGNDFVGQIDEVAVWSRALSATELTGLYTAGTNPVGVAAVKFVKTDIGAAMSNVNATAYIRLPFTIDNPANIQLLTLRVRHDDGFVAYLNGIEVVRANAPGALTYTSTATNIHSAATVDQFQLGPTALAAGANLLAIHGLNAAATDEDFLISAELSATHVAGSSTGAVYMTGPTPGTANGGGVSVLGPVITEVAHSPNVPLDSQDLVVRARVTPSFASIGSVVVRYRVMYAADIELPMFDDGTHGDILPGDGVYSQTLPVAAASTNGQMIRWYFRATDTVGRLSRWPLFLSPADTEYLGTIVNPTYVTSLLPIFHLFATNGVLQTAPPTTQTGADSEAGGRVSLFYDGEFYDNIYMELRGNTSAGQNKKSHRLEFSREHEFRHLPGFPRVRKTSLMAEFLDPAYIRQHLSFWLLEQMGMKTPYFYPVRAQLNSQFYGLVFHNDVIGQGQVERMGYDPKGALYKAAGNVLLSRSSTGVFQKLEPDGPPDYTDYNQLVNGIVETATLANRRIAAYDMLDIPEVINYLAGARWCAENDDVWANMSLYRDTFGDQLWRIIPFDMNASWGQRYGGITPLDAINDGCKSHPLYGCSTIIACDGSTYNRMYDVVIMVPELRQMLLRRQRTVLDRWVLEPGVAPESRLLETHIRYMTNLIGPEAVLDRAKWGYSTWTASNKPLGTAIPELFNEFINLRRIHWNGTHNVTNVAKPIGVTPTSNAGIPLAQPLFSFLSISNVEFNPSSGNQNQEFIQITNPNNYAVDITGWKLDGAVEFTFQPGTVIPSNSLFYVSPDVLAFKQRTTGPRGGQGNFVVGPYKGQLNARGETLFLFNQNSQLVVSNTYPGNPSPAQLYLRITEIMYNPARLAGNTNDAQEFEYLELKNISGSVTLNLTGVRLTNGVEFSFTGSAITSLAPGASVLVVRNMAAFTARYGALPNVAGQFTGSLDSNGETIRLDDASGEKVLEFAFNNTWYPITDGYGFSLVIVDANALWDTWGLKASWRASGALYGSPGNPDPTAPVFAPILVNEILTHTDPPLRDTVELLNPTTNDVNIGGWFLTDDFTNAFKYRFPNPTTIPAGGYLVVNETNFNPNPGTPPSFAFSSKGDEVLLLSGDANTNLTGYLTFENFGATASGVTLGRYTNSVGNVHFVAQSETTFGGPNAGPRVGPVIVSEINYHPPDLVDGSTRAANNIDEYIELHNISGTPTNLFDPAYPANTWSLRDAVNFTFPQNTVMAAGGYLLVVSFDPADSVALQHFITANSVTPGTAIYGPWEGALDNVEDSVELVRPDAPDPMGPPTYGFVPQILVDEVNYQSLPPWPPGANGIGASISRLNVAAYGNDPVNWKAAIKTAGAPTTGGTLPVITAQPADATGVETASAMFSVTATGTAPLGYQWAFNGELIDGAVNSVLVLNNLTTDRAGIYSCYVFNPAGTVLSSNAVLTVNRAATIVNHPVTTMVRVRPDPAAAPTTNATFTVAAVSTTPIRYQWRFNGTNIVGQTNTTLTITNVQVKDDGLYGAAVTDDVGTVFTTNAPLYALVTPVIFPGLISHVAVTGAPVTLSLALAVGNPPPYTVEWRRGSTPLATNVVNLPADFYTVLAPSPPTANQLYRILVRNLATTGNGVVATNLITSYLDGDGDGIPDPFDANPGLNDATLDSDEDGVNNYAEYVAGTNPNDKFSYLKIDRITAAGGAQLEFYAVSNRTYSVLYKGSLTNPTWSNLSDIAVRLTNRVEQVRDPSPGTNRIYRLVTPKQ